MNTEKMQYKLKEVRVKLAEGTALYSTRPMDSPQNAIRCMADMLSELDREYLCVVNMDSALRPINYNIVSIGGINLAPVSVGNVFKTAILSNAHSLILLHNHPSGNLIVSKADIEVTKKIYRASRLMDITLLDHIIVGGGSGDYCSMRECGLLTSIMDSCEVLERNTDYTVSTGMTRMTEKPVKDAEMSVPVAGIGKKPMDRNDRKTVKKHHRTR